MFGMTVIYGSPLNISQCETRSLTLKTKGAYDPMRFACHVMNGGLEAAICAAELDNTSDR